MNTEMLQMFKHRTEITIQVSFANVHANKHLFEFFLLLLKHAVSLLKERVCYKTFKRGRL